MNLYVSNLSFNTGEAELNELFSKYGTVTSVKVITDRETGRSRGFGFIEMATTDEGQNAITGMDGKEIEGRSLSVSQAKPKTERSSSGGGFKRNSGGNGGGYSKSYNNKW